MQEIEKKWHVKEIPQKYYQHDQYFIVQNYLSLTEKEQLRIRSVNNMNYYLTYKKGRGDVRKEIETEISENLYEKLLDMIDEHPIYKERKQIPIGNHTAVIDVFVLFNRMWIIVEVEFDSVEELEKFEKPDWFGEEFKLSNRDIWEEINNLG